jgi:hypothetical protein
VSVAAKEVLAQVRKLSPSEQKQILQELMRSLHHAAPDAADLPTVRVAGGPITSEQVTEVLDDE